MKKLLTLALTAAVATAICGCGKDLCGELKKQVCGTSPDTVACEKASRMTTEDECEGYLKDVARFVELTNTVVDGPGVQPPKDEPAKEAEKPEAPAPEKEVATEGETTTKPEVEKEVEKKEETPKTEDEKPTAQDPE